jgi:hypothetical protein
VSAENSPPIRPRINRILSVTPAPVARRENIKAPIGLEPQMTPAIPASQVARIRAWVKYGMTVRQVAHVTGIAADEIERILRTT